MKKSKLILLMLFIAMPAVMLAGQLKFTTFTSKKSYYDFEHVFLTYKIENGDYNGVQIPNSEDFEVVNNSVSSSSSRSMTIVNGKRAYKTVSRYEVTFELKIKKKGRVKIPQGILKYDGKTYKTPAFTIEVTALNVSTTEASKDRFIKAEVSKSSPYVGEGFTITYTLFTVDAITDGGQLKNAGQFKNFGPFSVKDMEGMTNSRVNINGRNYLLLVLQKHLLFPIKGGKVTVPSFTLNYVTYKYVNRGFFRTRGEEIPHVVHAPSVTVNVKPLPVAPADFCGLVGQFTLKRKLDKDELLINDALTAKYEFSGSGNFSTLKELSLNWNKAWEVFEPKSINGYKATGKTYVGKLTKEYVAIPRANGAQDIPGLNMSYFDLSSKKYKQLSVNKTNINVIGDEDLGGGNVVYSGSGQNVEIKGNDVRYLNNNYSFSSGEKSEFFASPIHHGLSAVLGFGSLFLLVFYKPKKASEQELISKKKKGALKKAKSVLKDAEKALNADDKEFYEKIEIAMNTYFMDRFNILPQDFSSESLRDALLNMNLSQNKIQDILNLQSKCGMARYSPIGVSKPEVFKEVQEMITELG
ncbi:MAG: hypothetical protein ACJA0Q_001052 [Saprospiraceae bacterium]|jgi:hypothetical protein